MAFLKRFFALRIHQLELCSFCVAVVVLVLILLVFLSWYAPKPVKRYQIWMVLMYTVFGESLF